MENQKESHSIGPRKPKRSFALFFKGLNGRSLKTNRRDECSPMAWNCYQWHSPETRQVQAFPACWAHGSFYKGARAKNTKRPDSKFLNR